MTAVDTRNEISRIDALIDDGRARSLDVHTPPTFPVAIQVHEVPRRKGRKPHWRFRVVAPDEAQDVEIYVSPTGHSVRVFRDGVELS